MTRRGSILAFLATALAGLVIRQLLVSSPVVGAILFGSQNYMAVQVLFRFWSLPTVLVATVAAYLSPKRFWLWVLAAVCLLPVEDLLTFYQSARAGVIGPSEYLGIAFVEGILFVQAGAMCVAGAIAGASLRLLVGRISGRTQQVTSDTNHEARDGSRQ